MANIIHQWDTSDHAPKGGKMVNAYDAYDAAHKRFGSDSMQSFMAFASVTCEKGCTDEEVKRRLSPAMIAQLGPGHMCARGVTACKHVLIANHERPTKIFWMPGCYYLCATCLKLLERRRLDLDYEMVIQCWHCVQREISRIKKIDPSLFVDFVRDNPDAAAFDPLRDKKLPT